MGRLILTLLRKFAHQRALVILCRLFELGHARLAMHVGYLVNVVNKFSVDAQDCAFVSSCNNGANNKQGRVRQ